MNIKILLRQAAEEGIIICSNCGNAIESDCDVCGDCGWQNPLIKFGYI